MLHFEVSVIPIPLSGSLSWAWPHLMGLTFLPQMTTGRCDRTPSCHLYFCVCFIRRQIYACQILTISIPFVRLVTVTVTVTVTA